MTKGAFMLNRVRTARPLRVICGLVSCLAIAVIPLVATAQQDAVVSFSNVRIFYGASDRLSAPRNVLVRGNKIESHFGRADSDRPPRRYRADRRRRAHTHARAHRHALAYDACAADTRGGAHRRRRLHQPGGGRRSDRHADARLHYHPRPGRTGLRTQTGNRRRDCGRPAHLPQRRDDHHDGRTRRLPRTLHAAAKGGRSAILASSRSAPP